MIVLHRIRITNFAMHLQIPHFPAKCAEEYKLSFTNPRKSPAFSRKTVPRFAGRKNSRHFSCKKPRGSFAAKQRPDVFVACKHPEQRIVQTIVTTMLPSSYPQSCRCCPVRYTRLRDVAPAGWLLNPGAFVRFVILGFTCISSYLTTHGHSALVTLGLESHALATFCSKSLCRLPVLLSFGQEAASSQHLCFNTDSINKHLQNIPPVQPPRSS